jgi:hypothetical protein
MRRLILVLSLISMMLVAASPVMADDLDDGFFVVDGFFFVDEDGDGIDDAVDDFVGPVSQEFEIEEAESGDVAPEAAIENTGDNVNQSVGLVQSSNSGNVQNIQGVNQFGVEESDDIEFESSSIELSSALEFESEQAIDQAVAVW